MRYRILLQSLRRSMRSHETKVEFVEADDILTACEIAKDRNPNLGITPTTVSMCWPIYESKK